MKVEGYWKVVGHLARGNSLMMEVQVPMLEWFEIRGLLELGGLLALGGLLRLGSLRDLRAPLELGEPIVPRSPRLHPWAVTVEVEDQSTHGVQWKGGRS
ncbi:hypothetical protein CYMTET_54677 [Cymbomonas tetramitiformis]|uniref:Uncharacterized protein n=1 Tax=Cymbomonas tetramitiformis TaxID=36881 RepID=A0AAE0BFN5_9CHLO|nr:hypothetical protein CYMTET_54677 [Cymbomonas tetramitiformis]